MLETTKPRVFLSTLITALEAGERELDVILERTMTESTTPSMSQVLAAQRWMEDEHGMERASLSPVEYVAYRMRISPEEAKVLVAAVYALDEDAD